VEPFHSYSEETSPISTALEKILRRELGVLIGVLAFRAQFAKVILREPGSLGGVLRHDIESTALEGLCSCPAPWNEESRMVLPLPPSPKNRHVLFQRSALFQVGTLAGGHVAAAGTSAHLKGPLFAVRTDYGLHQQGEFDRHSSVVVSIPWHAVPCLSIAALNRRRFS
jgi:hypothetical protein